MFTLLGRYEAEWIDLADLVALPHERYDEEPAEDHNKGHRAISPTNANGIDPGSDVEGDRQAKRDAEGVEHDGRLLDIVGKALGQVVDRNGSDAHRRVDDQNGGEG